MTRRGARTRRLVSVTVALGILLCVATDAHAQPPTVAPTGAPTATADPQIRILQAQLDQVQRDSGRDTAIIQWGFGSLVALAVLLLTLNWFANRREKEAFQEQIVREVRGATDALRKETDQRLAAAQASLAASNEDAFTRHAAALTNAERTFRSKVRDQQLSTEVEIKELQATVAALEGIPSNALLHSVQALRQASALSDAFAMRRSIERIKETLPKVYRLNPDETRDLDEAVGLIRPHYPTEADSLRSLITETQERLKAEERRRINRS